jgi:hypothetical protein
VSINITVASTVGGSFTVGSVQSSTANLTVSSGIGPQGAAGPQGPAGPVSDVSGGVGIDAINSSGNITLSLNAALSDLSDVSGGSPSAGQALVWSGSEWSGGDIPPGTTLNGLSGSLTLAAGGNVSIASSGSTITIDADTSVDFTGYATEGYVDSAISNLVGTAPALLDTLGELADALADDEAFAATVTTALAGKAAIGHTHEVADVSGFAAAAAANAPVQSVNGLTGSLTIAGGGNITVSSAGTTITVDAVVSGASGNASAIDGGEFPGASALLAEGGENLTSEAGDRLTSEGASGGAVIQLLRSGVEDAAPTSLQLGELAINYHAGSPTIFYRDTTGSVQAFPLTAASSSGGGGGYGSALLFG